MSFAREQVLVEAFVNLLKANRTPWGVLRYAREFDYLRGRADIVAVVGSNTLIAVEAKLEDWKYALHQAYRNTCFAHQSFVLLPKSTALTAASFLAEFEKRGVGLCYIEGADLTILHDSPCGTPIEPWLASKALLHADEA